MILVQLTGLSGAGKTTLATTLTQRLESHGFRSRILDGDVYRKTHSQDLGFSREDRIQQVYRMAEHAASARSDYDLQILAVINPYEEARNTLRQCYDARLVWLDCDLEELRRRDTKGLYRRASLPVSDPDHLGNLSGVNDPFELPTNPDLCLHTGREDLHTCIDKLLDFSLRLLHRESHPADDTQS